jgi:hypothetical protein
VAAKLDSVQPQPKTESRVKRQIKAESQAAYRRYRNLPDGATGTADRYLGECPAGDGRINFSYAYIVRAGEIYHAACDPQLPMFVTCERVGCGAAFLPRGENRFPVCDGCHQAYVAALWSVKGLQDFFAPLPKPKWL